MCKTRVFNEILEAVSAETEVSADCILSGKKDEETVDARYMLVHLLSRSGISHSSIAKLINKNVRTVNHIVTGFEARMSSRKMFGINLEQIKKALGNKLFS
ncbi:hypothetical protein [Parabacteroides goldsteinii]|uniref:hypothetical protein n=1 Tax=Parabacteroides goldsteinii TaxID=328812 RepID=UPI002671842E|nr:hypothetical protein [Parabacteroides goldsteinii]